MGGASTSSHCTLQFNIIVSALWYFEFVGAGSPTLRMTRVTMTCEATQRFLFPNRNTLMTDDPLGPDVTPISHAQNPQSYRQRSHF
jgi:hypothetical protein